MAIVQNTRLWLPRQRVMTPGTRPMNKDQLKGRARSAKGKLKEVAGRTVGNKKLEDEGKRENAGGKVESAWGDAKQDVKKGIKSVGDSID